MREVCYLQDRKHITSSDTHIILSCQGLLYIVAWLIENRGCGVAWGVGCERGRGGGVCVWGGGRGRGRGSHLATTGADPAPAPANRYDNILNSPGAGAALA